MSKWLERAKIPQGRIKEFEQNLRSAEYDEKAVAGSRPALLKFVVGVNLGFAQKLKNCTGKLALLKLMIGDNGCTCSLTSSH